MINASADPRRQGTTYKRFWDERTLDANAGPVVDAAGRRRRLLFGTPRGSTLTRQPSRAARAKGRALARRSTRLPLVRTSTLAPSCFPLLPDSFPLFPPLAACLGMPVNRHG